MTVTIFGATGTVGMELITHCMAKGWHTRAFGRNVDKLIDKDLRTQNFKAIHGYVFDEEQVLEAVTGADAVLSALGGAADGSDKTRSLGIKNIIGSMAHSGISRIVALGGKGVLQNSDGQYLVDGEDYPKEFVPVGLEHKQAYLYLKESPLKWTFICSPDILPQPADNRYTTESEAMPYGKGKIYAGNLALFMVEELERNQYLKQRVGISNT